MLLDMKAIAVCMLLCLYGVSGKMQCKLAPPDIPKEWLSMVDPCIKAVSDQIMEELTASMTYLAMGAHFSRDTINRPGFAELFFKSAGEEREHAIKLMEYLLMRGELTNDVSKLIKEPKPNKEEWLNGVHALKDALNLETHVTRRIRSIITTCEAATGEAGNEANDYHLVDYLTGVYLEEQYKGQRELAGYVSTLGKMMDQHGALGEFLFDKKLLSNQI